MCFVCFSEETVNFTLYDIKNLVFIFEVESVYCALRAESLHNINMLRLLRVNSIFGNDCILWIFIPACFSCSPPDLNLVVTNFIFCIHVKITTANG